MIDKFIDVFPSTIDTDPDFLPASLRISDIGRIRLCWPTTEKRHKSIYIGRLLYPARKKSKLINGGKRSSVPSFFIESDSRFLPERQGLIITLTERFFDNDLTYNNAAEIVTFFDFIDFELTETVDTSSTDSLKSAYIAYSEMLWNRVSLPNTEENSLKIRKNTAFYKQNAAKEAIAACLGTIGKETVGSWAIKIVQAKGEQQFKVVDDTKKALEAFHAHRYVFTQTADHLLADRSYPFVLEPQVDPPIQKQIYLSHMIFNLHGLNEKLNTRGGGNGHSDRYSRLYDQNGRLLDWDTEILPALRADGLITSHSGTAYYTGKYKTLYLTYKEMVNGMFFPDSFLQRVFNAATYHFTHILLGDTGANLAVLNKMPLIQPTHLSREGKYRIISFKDRKGGEYSVRMNPKMLQHWKKYIKLCRHIIGDITGLKGPRYFQPNGEMDTVTSSLISNPNVFWNSDLMRVTAKQWRDYSINIHLMETGDIEHSANQHQHTIETSRKHYIAVENRIAITELNDYFKNLATTINLYRNEPVGIREAETDEGHQGTTGRCLSNGEGPRRHDGFTEATPEPRCSAMLTCFFCAHYGLERSLDELIMLLSIRQWLPLHSKSKSLNIDEHMIKFEPMIRRIDDLLAIFSTKSSENRALYEEAKKQVEWGNLHPYWSLKIAALEHAGIEGNGEIE